MKKLFALMVICAMTCSISAQPPRHGNSHRSHPTPPPPCATQEQMQMVLETLASQSFDEKKLEVARLCVTIGHFCTDDLALMASGFSFDESKLAFLKYAYPYCTDNERYPTLHDCFSFNSNYEKLMEAVYPPRRQR